MIADASGNSTGTISFLPYGDCRNSTGSLPTNKLFTGQRSDNTGLYYYGARYYDPEIGRFISADTIVPNPSNPQSLNRYSYCLNNPLKYTDPTGHDPYSQYQLAASFGYTGGYTQFCSDCGYSTSTSNRCVTLTTVPTGSGGYDVYNNSGSSVGWVSNINDASGFAQYYARASGVTGCVITRNGSDQGSWFAPDYFNPHQGLEGLGYATPWANLVNGALYATEGDYGSAAISTACGLPIGWTGDIGENALKELGGEAQVYFKTSQGGRVVDQLVDSIANESKVGYTSLTIDVQKQISKEAELLAKGTIDSSMWHFYRSPVTGQIGPSGPLEEALGEAGIDHIVH